MGTDRAFHDHVIHDLLADVSAIAGRAMFGGQGIYRDGIFFAIIADGEFYFKIDGINRIEIQCQSSRPFVYMKSGKPIGMSYWLVPKEITENRDEFAAWIDAAVSAGRRAKP